MEEVGEIAGWYKKKICYGLPKSATQVGLKGEFGDLLYYITKLSEIAEVTTLIESKFKDDLEIPATKDIDIIGMIGIASERANNLLNGSTHSEVFYQSLSELMDALIYLIDHEGWSVEDIQYANLAKLERRHGDGFKEEQGDPAKRDLEGEDRAIS